MTFTEADIWRVLSEIREATAWPPHLVIDTAAETHGLDRDTCARVWSQRAITWQGE